ncbi:DUF3487 family protein [Suttonella ornithocola]|uniref:Conjugative transfer region protein n=1 Tax=Suttonella ornithocola TaxID=279832 RepID=A0A380MVR4_9GAMM|nr:DUF3487 family protein [Suttonella ornithocola]SUO96669.1 conjugative transfer region protein [Suttonella ornithocola]
MKPSMILTELEREPIVYFGCTWTEIIRATQSGMMMGAILGLVVGASVGILVNGGIGFLCGFLFLMGSSAVITMRKLGKIRTLRAGRPLFYEKHVLNYRSSKFVQPAKRYQRERNT